MVVITTLLWIALVFAGCLNYQERGDEMIDRLNSQIRQSQLDEIYGDLSSDARSLTPRGEFIRNMNQIVDEMREVDESITWKSSSVLLSNEMSDLYFVRREMEGNGRKLDIDITFSYLAGPLKYYDICVRPSESSTGGICATNAMRKI